jgi:hypothetical protein
MELRDLGIRERLPTSLPFKGAHPLLAPRYLEQFLVKSLVPVPIEVGFDEGRIEGLAVNLLGFGQRPIDIEDQGARPNDQVPYPIQPHGRWRRHLAHFYFPDSGLCTE